MILGTRMFGCSSTSAFNIHFQFGKAFGIKKSSRPFTVSSLLYQESKMRLLGPKAKLHLVLLLLLYSCWGIITGVFLISLLKQHIIKQHHYTQSRAKQTIKVLMLNCKYISLAIQMSIISR